MRIVTCIGLAVLAFLSGRAPAIAQTSVLPEIPDEVMAKFRENGRMLKKSGINPQRVKTVTFRPRYPKNAFDEGRAGWAVMVFTVRPDGAVANIRPVGSAAPEFVAATVEAMQGWLYEWEGDAPNEPLTMMAISRFVIQCAEQPARDGGPCPETVPTSTIGDSRYAEAMPVHKPVPGISRRLQRRLIREGVTRPSATIAFEVNAEGGTQNVRIVNSNNGDFADKAAEAVRKWRFLPLLQYGQPSDRGTLEVTLAARMQ